MKKFLSFFTCALFTLSADLSWQQLKNQTISEELPQIFGWCSKEKAEVFMDLIYEIRPRVCVEVGTFAGASSYPIACALRFFDCGIIYTIDAWNEEVLLKGSDEGFHDWWKNARINLEQICLNFHSMIYEKNLNSYCCSIRMLSEHAALIFPGESIDFLHLDGNSSTQGGVDDVISYFPKVKKGGYICLSHSKLPTRNKVLLLLFEACEWMQDLSKEDFIMFKKL